MALVELKFEDTVIYVEDNVPEEETGIALQQSTKENLENTIEMKSLKNDKDLLEDTISIEPIGDIYG